MRKRIKYWMLIFFMAVSYNAVTENHQTGFVLFTDRPWALSGDTIWFWLSANGLSENEGNVAHIQLETIDNDPVNRVMIQIREGGAPGYFPVPDSLRTGVYFLRGYNTALENLQQTPYVTRLLTIYNRFDDEIPDIEVPVINAFVQLSEISNHLSINTESEMVNTNEVVCFKIHIPSDIRVQIGDMVVSAAIEEPLASSIDKFYLMPAGAAQPALKNTLPPEKDGFFIEGRVVSADAGKLPDQSLVMLSIPDSIPYFDYYFANSDGYFRFKLKNAFGKARIFIRAIADNDCELSVELVNGTMNGKEIFQKFTYKIQPSHRQLLKDLLDASYFSRLFTGGHIWSKQSLVMPPPFTHAFYGKPDQRIIPSEFIDLPDFREISRELLPGVRFRLKRGTTSIHVLSYQERLFFERDPLRLVNGIPVFDNEILYQFSSNDIRYIDVVNSERIFGDLSFKGVVAIYLNAEKENWVTEQTTLKQFSISCLQLNKTPPYNILPNPRSDSSLPDLRQVYLFRHIDPADPQTDFQFLTSGFKGNVVIKIQGVTRNNTPFESTRKITVR